MGSAPTVADMRRVLMSMDLEDEEHGEVWLSYFDVTLSWFVDGRMQLRRPATTVCSLTHVTREEALELFALFAAGKFEELESQPWRDGDGDPRTPEARQRDMEAALAALRAQQERELLAELGPELPEEPCRHEGCSRGAVRHSVLCREHHVEQLRKRGAPPA